MGRFSVSVLAVSFASRVTGAPAPVPDSSPFRRDDVIYATVPTTTRTTARPSTESPQAFALDGITWPSWCRESSSRGDWESERAGFTSTSVGQIQSQSESSLATCSVSPFPMFFGISVVSTTHCNGYLPRLAPAKGRLPAPSNRLSRPKATPTDIRIKTINPSS
ncbi:uncharacterized protein EI97DRAFT_423002 [Westerdykella ornata]|uniref:Ig-like domain-containing protein n=1 Tax=Westerdykella ornata TaxID=318751 RepID=A0A6A6JFX8_WESOR|nr:uncharacterized protein EI97DRAFT_423002 [Westerdykella ornata]KAF2274099.1 hypothetical protein EI97DRAFT_423002 [Westerdykella ornata]